MREGEEGRVELGIDGVEVELGEGVELELELAGVV